MKLDTFRISEVDLQAGLMQRQRLYRNSNYVGGVLTIIKPEPWHA